MNYIVKNCPCIKHYDDIELDNRCMSDQGIPFFCENNPDCIIKQVIEKCRQADNSCDGTNCTECSGFYMCHSQLAREILQLFDIEEINK